LTVNVKAPFPAVAVFGEIDDRLGVGAGTTAVKVNDPDVPPPGAELNTDT
jgi:hypothetical protein